ncbi:MAG TPA: tryptophanase [Chloroflexota bacterium]|nr:tryptophanase [Chloroflexota bacterium]
MSGSADPLQRIAALGPVEPYRVKMVEPIRTSTREERERWLAEAGLNLFRVPAECVFIDLLTDSGTGAMSHHQWSGLMQGDESYAGARSFFRFRDTVRELFGLPEVIPTHQGRAAEHLLFSELVRPGKRVISNTFFDTTRANAEAAGAVADDLPSPDARDLGSEQPFKGDIDLNRLADVLKRAPAGEIVGVVMTVTNNAGGGQPVSMANLRGASELCRSYGIPLILDASRIAENGFFIRERERGYADKTVKEIVLAMGECADIMTMSAKKDGLVNIGGLLALRDHDLAERIRRQMVVTEGFPTYGGLAGRDLEAMAVGLREAQDEDYLAHRIGQVRLLADLLRDLGVPIIEPPGGHGVFVDAAGFLPHIPRSRYPGQALAVALYLEGGVRSCEIGSVMFGDDPDARWPELVRLAIPRRTYSNAQLGVVASSFASLRERRSSIRGVAIVDAPPVLRHFTAGFAFV